jgi:hypothetical protein
MKIELTDQQERAAAEGHPVEVVHRATNRTYPLIAKETFQSLQGAGFGEMDQSKEDRPMAPGVQRSRAAFLRDLPELLKNKRHDRWFALYHGDACVRIARKYEDLVRECRQRGIERENYYIGIIRHYEPEPEEIEQLPAEYDIHRPQP